MQTEFNVNTHKAAVQYLIDLGLEEKHAEGVVDVVEWGNKQYQNNLVTKLDLELGVTKLENQIEKVENQMSQVESRLEHKIEKEVNSLRLEIRDIHSSLIRWFIGALCAFAGLILTALKLFL